MLAYLRVESAVPNRHGTHPGVFTMLRGLRERGLDDADAAFAASCVDRSYALHDEPAGHHFDTEPRALSWFRRDAAESGPIADLLDDVVALLARHGIATREVRSADPGRIVFADDRQVVAVPYTHADWPL